MPVTLEQGVYTLIEDKVRDVLAADAQLLTVVALFEAGSRGDAVEQGEYSNQYEAHELPAVVSEVTPGNSEEPVFAEGGFTCTYAFRVVTVVDGHDHITRRRLALNIGARVETVLRAQWGVNQMAALDTLVPNAVLGTVTCDLSGTIAADDSDIERSIARSVAITTGTVKIDIRTE